MAINQAKLNEFLGKAITDMGAAMSGQLILLGDKPGLYKAMAESESRSSGRRNLNSTSLRLLPKRLWDKESHRLTGRTE